MTDLKLFHTQAGTMIELESSSAPLGKGLQTQFEKNLDTLLGVRKCPEPNQRRRANGATR